MNFLSSCIKGIVLGAGAILPGISSGVLCIIFGIYEKLIDSILGFFKDIKKNLKFLIPIALGGFFGCIIFSNILVYFFDAIPIQTKSLFIGLLLGSIYTLYKQELNKSKTSSFSSYLFFIVCFVIGLGLILFENSIVYKSGYYPNEFSFLFLVLSGFFMSFGIVIPRS